MSVEVSHHTTSNDATTNDWHCYHHNYRESSFSELIKSFSELNKKTKI